MDAASLLSTLRTRDVRLRIENGQLKCSAPVGALDAALREALTRCKPEIIASLRQAETQKSSPESIVPIKGEGSRTPIFVVSGYAADVFWLLPLARHLHKDQPVIGVQPPGLDGSEPLTSIEELASYQIKQIRRCRPHGPYLIAGHCSGGTLALEVARQLVAEGEQVPLLALIGSPFPTMFARMPLLWVRLSGYAKALKPGAFNRKLQLRRQRQKGEDLAGSTALAVRHRVESATLKALRAYVPQRYSGNIDLFVTGEGWHRPHLWKDFAATICEHHLPDFEVNELLLGPNVNKLAVALQKRLDQLEIPVTKFGPITADTRQTLPAHST